MRRNIFLRSVLFCSMLFAASCANIVPPSGGKMDLTPPKLLSLSPKDSLRNQKVNKIVLRFNKFVEVSELQKNMTMSPQLDIDPTVTSYGKRIEIKFVDSLLQPNTTYHLSLGNAITDNREKTPYGNFNYTFSTGPDFDSLQLRGRVIDAQTGMADTASTILLYPMPFFDSLLLSKKPMYVARAEPNGSFVIRNLPNKAFKIFAIGDKDNNKRYSGGEEKIAFYTTPVNPKPSNDSSLIILKSFLSVYEKKDSTITAAAPKYIGRKLNTSRNALQYIIDVDTAAKKGTKELGKPVKITLNETVAKIDTGKVYLSYLNSGIEAEASSYLTADSGAIYVHSNWQPEASYTLRLIKGWAKDTAGTELAPTKVSFITKRNEDYARLTVNIPAQYVDKQFVLYVFKGEEIVYQKPIVSERVILTLLEPGTYQMRIVADANGNGKWDAGNLSKQLQPEEVFPHNGAVILKSGWENDVDFKYSGNPLPNRPGASSDKSEFER